MRKGFSNHIVISGEVLRSIEVDNVGKNISSSAACFELCVGCKRRNK